MSEAIIVFKAIQDKNEQEQLFAKIIQFQETISISGPSDIKIRLRPRLFDGQSGFECAIENAAFKSNIPTKKITANVSIQGENYIFDTTPTIQADFVRLPVFNIFHLQKRKNFRYVIPKNHSAKFSFTLLNNTATALSCRLLDLSTEGCALEIPGANANMRVHDKVDGNIFLGLHKPIPVQGYIKNIRPDGDTALVLGIEFKFSSQNSESHIITALTDLQREVYFRQGA